MGNRYTIDPYSMSLLDTAKLALYRGESEEEFVQTSRLAYAFMKNRMPVSCKGFAHSCLVLRDKDYPVPMCPTCNRAFVIAETISNDELG